MRKLTLDETWKECLSMWKWIVENLPCSICRPASYEIEDLLIGMKQKWLHKIGKYEGYIENECFFCQFAIDKFAEDRSISRSTRQNDIFDYCKCCPGVLVQRSFSCQAKAYAWNMRPEKFYKKLLELNSKRIQKMEKEGKEKHK